MYVKYINERIGHGAFAEHEIKVNDIVGEYTGKVIHADKAGRMPLTETDYMMELVTCYAGNNWPTSLYH